MIRWNLGDVELHSVALSFLWWMTKTINVLVVFLVGRALEAQVYQYVGSMVELLQYCCCQQEVTCIDHRRYYGTFAALVAVA